MKMKTILILGTMVVSLNAFDQSLSRWEGDCEYDSSSACAIAAGMYEAGVYEDQHTGKMIKIGKNLKKAKTLYKKACSLGNNGACNNYKRLSISK